MNKFLCSLACTWMAIIDSQFYITDLCQMLHWNKTLNWWWLSDCKFKSIFCQSCRDGFCVEPVLSSDFSGSLKTQRNVCGESFYIKDICGYFQCAPFPRLQTGKVVWVLSFDP